MLNQPKILLFVLLVYSSGVQTKGPKGPILQKIRIAQYKVFGNFQGQSAPWGPRATVQTRDVKTPKFLGPARSSFFRPGPARNKFFYFRPVWANENILSSMFYNQTTNYLVLTDLQSRRLDFGSREEHIAKKLLNRDFKIF